ncbi:hypothetical protein [Kitasatospora sp. NPDC051164]|uniref:hypothetical protein n=1 Tax=Kitasatospora sp. NPDC051164 TaxID=3364055 RepID=UPI0037942954
MVGASAYLCGTGGRRYIEPNRFTDVGIGVRQFTVPATGVWAGARSLSAVHALLLHGPHLVGETIRESAMWADG